MEYCRAWLVWYHIASFLNSKFLIAVIGSAFGAFAGAYVVQRVIEKNKRQEIFLTELRNTNAAIMVSLSICNQILRFKKQLSLPVYEQFKKLQADLEEQKNELKTNLNVPYKFTPDFCQWSP